MNTLEYILNKYKINDRGIVEIRDMDRVDLASLFNELGFKVGAEIGTEQGLYAETLCQSISNLQLFCVDPWQAYNGYREHVSQEKLDGFFEITKQRLIHYNVSFVRAFSNDAHKQFDDESLDFVYIDGNHEYRHVVDDISNWYPKVKKGGIVAGHDYIRRKNAEYLMGVIPAVNGYCDAYKIEPLMIIGAKNVVEGEKRDRTRSWMFVK